MNNDGKNAEALGWFCPKSQIGRSGKQKQKKGSGNAAKGTAEGFSHGSSIGKQHHTFPSQSAPVSRSACSVARGTNVSTMTLATGAASLGGCPGTKTLPEKTKSAKKRT